MPERRRFAFFRTLGALLVIGILIMPGSAATTVDVAMVGLATVPWFCGGNMTLVVHGQNLGPWWVFSAAGSSAMDCPLDPTVSGLPPLIGSGNPDEGYHAGGGENAIHIGPLAFYDPATGRFVTWFAYCLGFCLYGTIDGMLVSGTIPSSILRSA